LKVSPLVVKFLQKWLRRELSRTAKELKTITKPRRKKVLPYCAIKGLRLNSFFGVLQIPYSEFTRKGFTETYRETTKKRRSEIKFYREGEE